MTHTRIPELAANAGPKLQANLHERCLEYLSKNTRDVVAVVNEGGCFEYASPAFLYVLGYATHEILGTEIIASIHPLEQDRAQEAFRRAFELGRLEMTEFRYRGADGCYRWVEAVGELLDGGGSEPRRMVIAARDVTERKRSETEIRWLMTANRRTIGGSIQALNRLVAQRDPYTASHQQRVASMSVAIAQRLGLDAHQVLGLKFAAEVHDLGKLTVPSELLTKPGRLSPLEFEIIRTHADAGQAILREIDFPWPLADMVYQHHERLDGSGYHGMKGHSLLVESRILSVADVVEAMSSHRPYRPALGMDRALAEVQEKSGCCFDPAVVAACVKLEAEGGLRPEG